MILHSYWARFVTFRRAKHRAGQIMTCPYDTKENQYLLEIISDTVWLLTETKERTLPWSRFGFIWLSCAPLPAVVPWRNVERRNDPVVIQARARWWVSSVQGYCWICQHGILIYTVIAHRLSVNDRCKSTSTECCYSNVSDILTAKCAGFAENLSARRFYVHTDQNVSWRLSLRAYALCSSTYVADVPKKLCFLRSHSTSKKLSIAKLFIWLSKILREHHSLIQWSFIKDCSTPKNSKIVSFVGRIVLFIIQSYIWNLSV